MQINSFYNYAPIIKKTANQSFKSSASELNDLWEDNEATSGLWKKMSDDYGMGGHGFFLPPTVKVHKVWDEVNGFKNLKVVNSTDKIYTGYTLVKTPEKIKELKDTYGVKTIVDLVGYNEYRRQCENAGVNYFGDFNLYYNMYDTAPFLSQEDYLVKNRYNGSKPELIEKHKEATLKFGKNLNKLLKVLDTGHVYMGCDHGHSRTNDVILLVNKYTNSQKLSLDEDAINDLDYKKFAIKQFERNLKMYSEN